MSKKLFAFCMIASLVLSTISAPLAGVQTSGAKTVDSIHMFQGYKFDAHYRAPRDVDIQRILKQEGAIPLHATKEQLDAATHEFMNQWAKRNPDTPNPAKLRELLNAEESGNGKVPPESPIKILVTPVEFPNTATFTDACGKTQTFTGPLHNEIPAPGPRDNNTVWYNDTTPDLYNQLYFGVGPKAGVVVHHPNLGDVDLRGNTMANYYLEQSEGKFLPAGEIYPGWVKASKPEAWYGQDSCDGASHNIHAADLVVEVLNKVNALNPGFNWQKFDGDGNGVVDNFTVLHAGMGQEAGGGAQGDWSIWSHASIINYPTGYLVCTAGNVGCPNRNIYVREYSMDPENIDIGVISEEFGHAAFGLPDMYTTDLQMSLSNWAIMEAGSWNGILGGMQPAPFPLWFRSLVGWAKPVEINYNTAPTGAIVGQLSQRPAGTASGLKINLPDKRVVHDNPLGTGKAYWSTAGDLLTNAISHGFDLTSTASPVFSFKSAWAMEEDWDGGYVQVSTDGGATWTALPDMDGKFTQNTLNGNNPDGNWVLTGEDQGALRFDLSAYAGQAIQLRLLYVTDMAVQWAGWWADDFSLDDGSTNLFSDNVETPPNGWSTDSWQVVPFSESFKRYYLVEWRNLSGFDRGLQYPYSTVYYDEDEWQVDRCPYTAPGMLVYFRDTSYQLDYTLGDSLYDSPSWGPKHGIILVDSHSFPYQWSTLFYSSGMNGRVTDRCQPADAAFTLKNTTPFTLRYGSGDAILETKTFGPRPKVSQFHDSISYYPGFWYNTSDGYLYWWNAAASAVIPAKGDYTTRITNRKNIPLKSLYGIDIGGTVLGSGNPGDAKKQFGLHIALVNKDLNNTWAQIKVWNSPAVATLTEKVNTNLTLAGNDLTYTVNVTNTTPIRQLITIKSPLPANTAYKQYSPYYNVAMKAFVWQGYVAPSATISLTFTVRIPRITPSGTVITSTTTMNDGALGGTATVKTTVK